MTNVNPLLFWAPAALLLPVTIVAAYCYLSLRVELRVMAKRTVTRADLDARWTELVAELEGMRTRLALVESKPALPDWAPQEGTPSQSVNLNRRGQILRLHGKGRSSAEIASDLQISQGEVELLLKVHDWSATTNAL